VIRCAVEVRWCLYMEPFMIVEKEILQWINRLPPIQIFTSMRMLKHTFQVEEVVCYRDP
jgi:hypothetical protein